MAKIWFGDTCVFNLVLLFLVIFLPWIIELVSLPYVHIVNSQKLGFSLLQGSDLMDT